MQNSGKQIPLSQLGSKQREGGAGNEKPLRRGAETSGEFVQDEARDDADSHDSKHHNGENVEVLII